MDALTSLISPEILGLSLVIALLAGVIKGVVGFAMPVVLISSLGSIMAPDLALAALILPTLVTNAAQALRYGWRAAMSSINRFRVFMGVGLVMLVATAQLVRVLPDWVMLLIIGIPVTVFATLQFLGWHLRIPDGAGSRAEWIVGAIAGGLGGVSGIWGPPTVTYLTALNTPKAEQMRTQGVIYGLGALALALAHLQSGVLRVETAPLSALLVMPAVIGLIIGFRLQDRMDQALFKRVTLVVLIITGLNLVRRGLFG